MNRAQKMLEVLRDGRPHSRREIFEEAGFMLTNNAAAELRAMGYEIRQWRERVNGDNVYFYGLLGHASDWKLDSVHDPLPSLDEVDAEQRGTGLPTDGTASASSRDSDSLSAATSSPRGSHPNGPQADGREQESLFTYPRTPDWS